MVAFFGETKPMDKITVGDAKDFRTYLNKKLAKATANRTMGIAHQFFNYAIDHELLTKSPFKKLVGQVKSNPEKQFYIDGDLAQKVLAALPHDEWKLIFGLMRWGGLRCPSEIVAIKWADINWAANKFTVHASKTEHHDDNGEREVPIFPELAPLFKNVDDPKKVWVINQYRKTNANLSTTFKKYLKKAGITPWVNIFDNLRASRETELRNLGWGLHQISFGWATT